MDTEERVKNKKERVKNKKATWLAEQTQLMKDRGEWVE
jgi:hypothetical protein